MAATFFVKTSPFIAAYSALLPEVCIKDKSEDAEQRVTRSRRSLTGMGSTSVGWGESQNSYLQIIFSIGFLTLVRLFWQHAVLIPNGWVHNSETIFVLGSLTAATHSTLLIPPLFSLLMTHPTKKPAACISVSPPTWNYYARALLSLTIAYMVQDGGCTLYYSYNFETGTLLFSEEDKLFLAHHFATVFCMVTCRMHGAGHYMIMCLMFFGEITNPFQNSYAVLEAANKSHPGLRITFLLYYSGKMFSFSYILFRIFIAPFLAIWLLQDVLLTKKGRANVHPVLGLWWGVMTLGVMVGSIPFAFSTAKDAWDQ